MMKAELKVVLEDGTEKRFKGEFEKNDYKRLERKFNQFIMNYNSQYYLGKGLTDEEMKKMLEDDEDFKKLLGEDKPKEKNKSLTYEELEKMFKEDKDFWK